VLTRHTRDFELELRTLELSPSAVVVVLSTPDTKACITGMGGRRNLEGNVGVSPDYLGKELVRRYTWKILKF
jgi:hypothetical protein